MWITFKNSRRSIIRKDAVVLVIGNKFFSKVFDTHIYVYIYLPLKLLATFRFVTIKRKNKIIRGS